MMQGRWIVELAEMEVIRRTDEEALKAFITRRTDLARLAYGRTVGEFPRQSIFIASKNPRADGTYLKDDTGNRRWWPVRCEPRRGANKMRQVDFKKFKEARDQIFAEAVARMKTVPGEKLFMETAALKELAKDEAALRHAPHAWHERISSWLADLNSRPETRRDFLTARDVFIEAMGGLDKHLDRKSLLAIAQVLRSLGWNPGNKRHGTRVAWGYLAPSEESDTEILGDLL
jgi:predicted P-loop ATPase